MATVTRTRRKWTSEEDRTLIYEAELQLSQRMTIINWKSIAAKIPRRTNKDCCKRWSKVCRNNNKGAWDKAEDARLQNAVGVYGLRWSQVAAEVGTRHADQCAKRWYHSLDPSVDRSVWREDEDQKLLAARKMYGQRWKVISDNVFPRRSPTDIKNRYAHFSCKRTLRTRAFSLDQTSSSRLSRTQSPASGLDFDSSTSSDNLSHSPYLRGLPTPPSESVSDWPIDPSSTYLPCTPVSASTQAPSLRANNGCLTPDLFAGLTIAQIDASTKLPIWPGSTAGAFPWSDLDLPLAAATPAAFSDTSFYANLLLEHEQQQAGFNELNIDPLLQGMNYQQQQQHRMNMTLALEGVDQTTFDNVVLIQPQQLESAGSYDDLRQMPHMCETPLDTLH